MLPRIVETSSVGATDLDGRQPASKRNQDKIVDGWDIVKHSRFSKVTNLDEVVGLLIVIGIAAVTLLHLLSIDPTIRSHDSRAGRP